MGKTSLSFRDKAWASSAVNTEFDAWDGLPSMWLSANQYKAQGPRMTIVSEVQTSAITTRRAHFIAVLASATLACVARLLGSPIARLAAIERFADVGGNLGLQRCLFVARKSHAATDHQHGRKVRHCRQRFETAGKFSEHRISCPLSRD